MDLPAFSSLPGICEITVHPPAGAPRGWLLVEVPHGATRPEDYFSLARKMKSELPAQLEHFFFVNTDVGAPDGAAWLASTLPADGIGVVFARCLFPRTFIDPNRVLGPASDGRVVDGLTPGLAPYIDAPEDRDLLVEMHRAYHALVAGAYHEVCTVRGGLALQLHSFSPRSVGIEIVDRNIVTALHAAYEPDVYATWPERPQVDLICATADGSFAAAPALAEALVAAYDEAGITAQKNATYALHPSTMGYVYATQYPEQVMCVELNRGLVASPFVPFGPSPIDPKKVERMVAPIAGVVRASISAR
ncbi:MAG: N-formylglutamate amidohydrolase [Polyangia bacterium]